jgi:hypothetical protein
MLSGRSVRSPHPPFCTSTAGSNPALSASHSVSLTKFRSCEQAALLGPVERQIKFGETRAVDITRCLSQSAL